MVFVAESAAKRVPIDETNCPVRLTIGLIGGKWKPIILYYLKEGPVRFGEMRRMIPHASHKVLAAQLRELERDRIIERTEYSGKIKHVEYSYSDYGRSLAPILSALADWGSNYATHSGRPVVGRRSAHERV